MTNTALEIKNLYKSYGDIQILKDINLQIAAGECRALLGSNGAGKTTLLGCIYGIKEYTGSIDIYGIPSNSRESRKNLGIVAQENLLDADLSVIDNIVFHIVSYDFSFKEAKKLALEALEQVGLSNKRNHTTASLSGGMKRRLAVARAISSQPKILLLDEPTVALDVESRLVFWELINGLKQSGMSILLTSHYFDEIQNLAETVSVLRGGQIEITEEISNILSQHNSFDNFYHSKVRNV